MAVIRRSRRSARCLLLSLTTILGSGLAVPAFAQSSPHPNLDANGVDLTTGAFNLQVPLGSIGSGAAELPLVAYSGTTDNWSQYFATTSQSGGTTFIVINLGTSYDNFSSADNFAASSRGTGATLTVDSGSLTYRTLDGVTITFGDPNGSGSSNICGPDSSATTCTSLALSISGKTGMETSFDWFIHLNCQGVQMPDDFTSSCTSSWRLAGVSNSAGYAINWAYASDYVAPGRNAGGDWNRRTTATFTNVNAVGSAGRVVTYANPSTNVYTITTPGGKTWRITGSGQTISAVKRPGASSDSMTIAYGGYAVVSSVTNDGVTTNYSRSVSGSTATMVVTDAQAHATTIVSDIAKFRPTSVTDALGRTTSLSYDAVGRPTAVSYPEGDGIQYSYDARGNVTAATRTAKPGSGLGALTTSASYPTTCADAACDSPVWTRDAKGNQTDYTYDTDGLLTSVTGPAPTSGAARPQTRYTYTPTNGVAMLTGVSMCRTGSSCAGTADEVKTSIVYDTNLRAVSRSAGSGDGALTTTTTASYNADGDMTSVDGPLPGADDTTSLRWSADRERLGVISADPDGGGPRLRRAVRTTYNADGQPATTERGAVYGTSDANWAAFSSFQQSATTYDSNGRAVRNTVTAGGTTYGVTQYSYDSLGRLDCTAQRMNMATFGALPDACSLASAGSAGPDTIRRANYDAVGRIIAATSALGTAEASTEQSSYTPNGRLAAVVDGANNKTTYGYDGFDRLTQTVYPVYTPGQNGSNGGDYEQLGYDANGNVTSRRLRDGQVIGYTYDALDRLVLKDVPNSVPNEFDITYAYDLLGQLTQARDSNTHVANFVYDGLGRKTSEQSNWTTRSWQYDAAGKRTRLDWGDGLFVTYDYLVTGEMKTIRENGGLALASFAYDDLGRRTSLTRGNGTTTSYSYDPASRLSTLTQDLTGSAQDLSLGFTYNPAGQIAGRTSSNDAYAFTQVYNADRSYTANGLNQYTASGAIAPTYDGRGNLTSAGGPTYGYTSENRLATTSTGYMMTYDPLGRYHWIANGPVTWMQYDGGNVIEELTGNGVARRYVFGPGTDEPLVWYEGAGTSDRRYLHADERGSVIAVTNDAGAAIAINSYDEFGIPGSGNIGRFQYTGQKWIPELGMYDYKARMYSPTLGRFLQTDPIGYGDGLNWYNYVGSDPVNSTDSTGLQNEDDDDKENAKKGNTVTVIGTRPGGSSGVGSLSIRLGHGSNPISAPPPLEPQNIAEEIVVTARRTAETLKRAGSTTLNALTFAFDTIRLSFDQVYDSIAPPCCFTAGTMVLTPAGLKAIETLKVGELVISRSDSTGETAAKPIVGITPAHMRQIWTVTLSYKNENGGWTDERYQTTDDHPWRTDSGHWVVSASLKQGQVLSRKDGSAFVAEVVDTKTTKLTYNLEVADYHSYFVGNAKTWVHNACAYVFKTDHYAPRLVRAGVDVQSAESAVRAALEAGGSRNGSVQVGGQTLLYRSYVLPSGTVSIGTIHIPW